MSKHWLHVGWAWAEFRSVILRDIISEMLGKVREFHELGSMANLEEHSHPRSSKSITKTTALKRCLYRIHTISGHHCILEDIGRNILNYLFPLRKLQRPSTQFVHSVMWYPDPTVTCFVKIFLTLKVCFTRNLLNLKPRYPLWNMYPSTDIDMHDNVFTHTESDVEVEVALSVNSVPPVSESDSTQAWCTKPNNETHHDMVVSDGVADWDVVLYIENKRVWNHIVLKYQRPGFYTDDRDHSCQGYLSVEGVFMDCLTHVLDWKERVRTTSMGKDSIMVLGKIKHALRHQNSAKIRY